MNNESKRIYVSTTHPGTGWWGAPWGHNLPEVKERVPGHGCATCCEMMNDCKQCESALKAAASNGEDEFETTFCVKFWHHCQMEEGCQCGRCRIERDQNGAKQADDVDLDPLRRFVAFSNCASALPREKNTFEAREAIAEFFMGDLSSERVN